MNDFKVGDEVWLRDEINEPYTEIIKEIDDDIVITYVPCVFHNKELMKILWGYDD